MISYQNLRGHLVACFKNSVESAEQREPAVLPPFEFAATRVTYRISSLKGKWKKDPSLKSLKMGVFYLFN